jgi:hypothetical protein
VGDAEFERAELDADDRGRWYRDFESMGVVIGLIGGFGWGLAAKPGNSAMLLVATIVTTGIGETLVVAGVTGHVILHHMRRKAQRATVSTLAHAAGRA